jgi:hypothetical protein
MGQSLPADRMDSFLPVGYQRQPQLMSPLGLPDVDQYGLTSDPMYGVGDQPMRAEVPLAPGDLASLAKLLQTLGRSHPKYIAAKKWFHGTGDPNMTSEKIDPFYGSHESLFGQGFYMTDEPKMATGYAKGAGRRGRPGEASTVYEAEIAAEKILDLEKPVPDDVRSLFRDFAHRTGKDPATGRYASESEEIISEYVYEALEQKNATTETLIKAFRDGVKEASHELGISTTEFVDEFQDLAISFREMGYDALTHTGGLRTGSDPHQVMIMLDPNDAYSLVGRGDQIRRFKPTAHE